MGSYLHPDQSWCKLDSGLQSGKDLTEPAENVRIGSSILREYLDASGGDLGAALKRYSGGGKGYAQRVAFHMRQFSASLHTSPEDAVKVELVRSP